MLTGKGNGDRADMKTLNGILLKPDNFLTEINYECPQEPSSKKYIKCGMLMSPGSTIKKPTLKLGIRWSSVDSSTLIGGIKWTTLYKPDGSGANYQLPKCNDWICNLGELSKTSTQRIVGATQIY